MFRRLVDTSGVSGTIPLPLMTCNADVATLHSRLDVCRRSCFAHMSTWIEPVGGLKRCVGMYWRGLACEPPSQSYLVGF